MKLKVIFSFHANYVFLRACLLRLTFQGESTKLCFLFRINGQKQTSTFGNNPTHFLCAGTEMHACAFHIAPLYVLSAPKLPEELGVWIFFWIFLFRNGRIRTNFRRRHHCPFLNPDFGFLREKKRKEEIFHGHIDLYVDVRWRNF